MSVSLRVFAPLLLLLREAGVDADGVLSRAGIAPAARRVGEGAAARLCAGAVSASGDPGFALRAGLSADAASLGVLGYVMQNCASVGEAFDHLQRYWRLLHDEPLFRIEAGAQATRLILRRDGAVDPLSRQALVEYMISFVLRLSGSLVGGDQRGSRYLRALSFRFPRPDAARLARYAACFGDARLLFGQSHTAIHFDPALLRQAVAFADPRLLPLFKERLQDELRDLGRGGGLSERVRSLLREQLPGRVPTLPEMAGTLGMSRASVQRRLADEGASYSAVVDGLRREMADELLRGSELSIGEIAFTLGYGDTPAFHHAYRRWTGLTPAQARAGSEADSQ